MNAPDPEEPLRETLQRAVWRRLHDHPSVAGLFVDTDAWLIARHAVDAVLEIAMAADVTVAVPSRPEGSA